MGNMLERIVVLRSLGVLVIITILLLLFILGCSVNRYNLYQDIYSSSFYMCSDNNEYCKEFRNCENDNVIINYTINIKKKIYSNWIWPNKYIGKHDDGSVRYEYVVERDGSVSTIKLLNSSGYKPYEEAAESAIRKSSPFDQIPSCADNTLTIKADFIYKVDPSK